VIEKLFSPAGDTVLRAFDSRQVDITGTIAACPSEKGEFAVVGAKSFILADQTRARLFAGHRVRIVGIVHESTGLLDIRRIDSLAVEQGQLAPADKPCPAGLSSRSTPLLPAHPFQLRSNQRGVVLLTARLERR
jgi:hypothetical protein